MERFVEFEKFLPNAPLTERVGGFLEKLIIEGIFKPRERLIETELSTALGVSRAPIREALRALEREELVTFSPGRGAMVAEITEKEIQDVYLIRTTLESLAVKIAAVKMSREILAELDAIYKLMEKAANNRELSSYFKFNQEFHDKIMDAADNEKLSKILKNLGKQTLRFRFFALSAPGQLEQSMENHRLLLAALKSKDADRAGELRLEHIRSGGEILKTQISNRLILNSL